jgi:DNA-binding CsgD family transcriptional regulator
MAVLAAAFDDAAAGRPEIVLVEGPAGVGKTALLEHFAARHARERTVRAGGLESEARVPFGVATQVLRDLAGSGAPDLAGADEVTDVGARLLSALSAEPVTILVIDDAQWADLPSLQALAFAFRRLDVDRVIAVIGSRPSATAAGDLLARLVEGHRGAHIVLSGLSAAEVARLASSAGQHLSAAAALRLRQHTDGLPLHVIALLRELDPATVSQARGPLPAPQSFSTLVLGRVAASGQEVESLVAAAAILGERCDVATAAAVAGVPDPLEAVNGAAVAGLAGHRRSPAGDELWFSHALVRAAVLEALAPARRAELHRRAATFLDGVAVIEHLAAAAILPDLTLAGRLADAATDEASRGAADLAAHHFLEAARLSPDPRAARARRLDALEVLVLAGAVTAARGLADDLRADLEREPDEPRAAYLRGHLALLDGHPSDAERLLDAAWRAASSAGDGRIAALAATQLAQLCLVHARNREVVAWSARAAEAAGDDPALAHASNGIRLVALTFSGHPAEAMAETVPDELTAGALADGWFDDIAARGLVRLWTDDLAGARRDLKTVADPSLRHRPLRARLMSLGYLAETEYRAGRWDDTAATAELAVSLAGDAEHVWLFGLLHGIAALPLAGRGQWAAAQAHIDVARRAGAELGDVMSLAYAGLAMIAVAAAKGEMSDVLAITDLFAAMDPTHGAMEPGVLTWCPARIEALAAAGRHDEAADLAGRAQGIAEARGRGSAVAGALRARGVLESARGHPDAAAAAFERSAACLPAGMTFESGLLGLAFGIHLRRSGRRRRAGDHLRAALDAFDALGARPYVERAAAELRACGITPRRRGPALPVLTGREHAVATLVAEGLTNREIAERLVVSSKTVEYHLANSFAKLGVRSRAQLAARIGAQAAEH